MPFFSFSGEGACLQELSLRRTMAMPFPCQQVRNFAKETHLVIIKPKFYSNIAQNLCRSKEDMAVHKPSIHSCHLSKLVWGSRFFLNADLSGFSYSDVSLASRKFEKKKYKHEEEAGRKMYEEMGKKSGGGWQGGVEMWGHYLTPEAKRMKVIKQFKDRWEVPCPDQLLSQLVIVVEDNP